MDHRQAGGESAAQVLGLVPWYYRAGAVALLALAVYFYGYTNGHVAQLEADNEKFAEIRATQDQQAIHAGKVALDRQATISAVVDGYEDDRTRLARYYDKRLRDARASGPAGAVPGDKVPGGVDASACDDGLARYVELQGRCAEVTLQLVNLQKAARAYEEIH